MPCSIDSFVDSRYYVGHSKAKAYKMFKKPTLGVGSNANLYHSHASHQYTHLIATVAFLSRLSRLVHENLSNFMCVRFFKVQFCGLAIVEHSGLEGVY